MMSAFVCIDVPDLAKGLRFYSDAFGFSKISEPYPGVAVLRVDDVTIELLEKGEQTRPSPNTRDVRHYDRHWTPVHLDFHVEDLSAALDKAVKAGAIKEKTYEDPEHGSAAFCSDPFGNGFCLIQHKSP